MMHPRDANVAKLDWEFRNEITKILMREPDGSWNPYSPRLAFLHPGPPPTTDEERAKEKEYVKNVKWLVKSIVKRYLDEEEVWGYIDTKDKMLCAVCLWEPPVDDGSNLFNSFVQVSSSTICFLIVFIAHFLLCLQLANKPKGYLLFGNQYGKLMDRLKAEEHIRRALVKDSAGLIHHLGAIPSGDTKYESPYGKGSPVQKLVESVVKIPQSSYALMYLHDTPHISLLTNHLRFYKVPGSAGDFLVLKHKPASQLHQPPAKPLPGLPAPTKLAPTVVAINDAIVKTKPAMVVKHREIKPPTPLVLRPIVLPPSSFQRQQQQTQPTTPETVPPARLPPRRLPVIPAQPPQPSSDNYDSSDANRSSNGGNNLRVQPTRNRSYSHGAEAPHSIVASRPLPTPPNASVDCLSGKLRNV